MQQICNRYATDMQQTLKISCSTQHLPIQDGRAVLPNIYPYIDPLFAVGDLCWDIFFLIDLHFNEFPHVCFFHFCPPSSCLLGVCMCVV